MCRMSHEGVAHLLLRTDSVDKQRHNLGQKRAARFAADRRCFVWGIAHAIRGIGGGGQLLKEPNQPIELVLIRGSRVVVFGAKKLCEGEREAGFEQLQRTQGCGPNKQSPESPNVNVLAGGTQLLHYVCCGLRGRAGAVAQNEYVLQRVFKQREQLVTRRGGCCSETAVAAAAAPSLDCILDLAGNAGGVQYMFKRLQNINVER